MDCHRKRCACVPPDYGSAGPALTDGGDDRCARLPGRARYESATERYRLSIPGAGPWSTTRCCNRPGNHHSETLPSSQPRMNRAIECSGLLLALISSRWLRAVAQHEFAERLVRLHPAVRAGYFGERVDTIYDW